MNKQILLGAATIIAFGSSAMAADLPVKAPPIVCPTCSWAGFYVGVNAGGSIGHDPANDTVLLNPAGTTGGLAPGVINPISNQSYSQSPTGAMAGVQAGFNWQVGQWLLGFEGDVDWSGQRDRVDVHNFIASSVVVAPAVTDFSHEQKINWLATARARAGWVQNCFLWYITGGFAGAGVDSNYAYQATGAGTFASGLGVASFSGTRTGWTVGAGVETSLSAFGAGNWSAKIEYLYVDLGSERNAFAVPLTGVAGSAYSVTSDSQLRDHIIRVGLNYRFGDRRVAPQSPVSATCTTCNWGGFYVGLNAGGSIGRGHANASDSLVPPTANAANVTNPLSDVSYSQSPIGGLAGGQVGFNWQSGNLVVGGEADWDWAGQRDRLNNVNFVASTVVVAPTQLVYSDERKLDWLATARARVGWAQNCFLWYLTGGAAWGHVETNNTLLANQTIGAGILGTGTALTTAGFSTNKSGWTVGGGVETSLAWLGASNHWSTKLEYLYVDLGNVSNTVLVPVVGSPGIHALTTGSGLQDHIIRVGLNYRFGRS